MDLFLRGESGVSATRELCRRHRGARVLILTAIDNPSFVREAFAAGARGYALKEQTADEIFAAVRVVAGGMRYLPARFDPELMGDGKPDEQPEGLFGHLSAREREIFNLVVAGHAQPAHRDRAVHQHQDRRDAPRAHQPQAGRAFGRRARPLRRAARSSLTGKIGRIRPGGA